MVVECSIPQIVQNHMEVTSITVNEKASVLIGLQVMPSAEHDIEERRTGFIPQSCHGRGELVASDAQTHLGVEI